MTEIDCPQFRVRLPVGAWSDYGTPESFDYRLADREQIIGVVHIARERLTDATMLRGITWLAKGRLEATQKYSENSCVFEPQRVIQAPDRLDMFYFGQDFKNKVWMHVGFFGRPDKVLVLSYYDYTGSLSEDEFRERSKGVMESLRSNSQRTTKIAVAKR